MKEKKEMQYNFDMIIPRLEDSFKFLELEQVQRVLSSFKGNSICIGTGGSNAVSHFASVVLEKSNDIISLCKEPRDILHMNLEHYDHLLGISYGNNNHGINEARAKAAFQGLSTHVITTNPKDLVHDIDYKGILPNERSFISLASTIKPMSIILNYHLNNSKEELIDLVASKCLNASKLEFNYEAEENFPIFEIMSGDSTNVACKVLESTIAEAGIGIPVVHEKYSFCHGRSTLPYTNGNSNLIYLINEESEIDQLLLDNITELYKNVVVLRSQDKSILGEFDLAIQAFHLCKYIAHSKSKDISAVKYSEVVRKLYKFYGKM